MMIKRFVVVLGLFGAALPALAQGASTVSASHDGRSAQVTTLAQSAKTQFGIDIKLMSFSSRQA